MKFSGRIRISVPGALHLADLILALAPQAENDLERKILLRAGIKIADLALECAAASRKIGRAA